MSSHPVVQKRDERTRKGRGFSRDELREAGINLKQALKLGLPIDLRRNTKHKKNVKILEKYLKSLGLVKSS